MKKRLKKILVATNHLQSVGGSELYTYDLIKALSKLAGIEVEYFALQKGMIADKIEEELGVSFMSKRKYDLIFASHNTAVKELFSKAPIIQICHGIVPEIEQPSPLADYHVAISEEVSAHLNRLGYENEVVLNGIDIRAKKPITPLNRRLKKVLSLCQSEKANSLLRTICKKKGLEFTAFNKLKNPALHIEETINAFDLVVGIGRSIYDAMACGRPCLIYDSREYNGSKADGYLRPDNFVKYVKNNCSGRYLNRHYQETEIIRELDKYNPDDGKRLRELAVTNLNAYKTVYQLLNMVDQLNWKNRLAKWKRFLAHAKLVKRAYLYRQMYALTKHEYFNK